MMITVGGSLELFQTQRKGSPFWRQIFLTFLYRYMHKIGLSNVLTLKPVIAEIAKMLSCRCFLRLTDPKFCAATQDNNVRLVASKLWSGFRPNRRWVGCREVGSAVLSRRFFESRLWPLYLWCCTDRRILVWIYLQNFCFLSLPANIRYILLCLRPRLLYLSCEHYCCFSASYNYFLFSVFVQRKILFSHSLVFLFKCVVTCSLSFSYLCYLILYFVWSVVSVSLFPFLRRCCSSSPHSYTQGGCFSLQVFEFR